jgi:hypothetical protein
MIDNYTYKIAREYILYGDVVRVVWKNYCRRASAGDKNLGIAMERRRKGSKIKIYIPTLNNTWTNK